MHVTPMRMRSEALRVKRNAFTLIELLVVIGVIGIIIGLLLPALSGAKSKAVETVTRANLRQSHMAFSVYTTHYKETYPWRPQGGDMIRLEPHGIVGIGPGHFDISVYWPGLMHDIMPWGEHFRSWLGGGARFGEHPWLPVEGSSDGWRGTSFHMSETLLARPRLWKPGETDTERNLRPVRENDVLYPASKVLLYDFEKTHLRNDPDADRDQTLMLFVDGHVAAKRLSEARVLTDRPWREPRPLHDTPDGARGRDY